jgi:iduronate 2-sulfatase
MGYSIRTERYRYTEWRDFRTGQVQARELYDHSSDLLETTNIAGSVDQKTTVAELALQLDKVVRRSAHPLDKQLGPETKQ